MAPCSEATILARVLRGATILCACIVAAPAAAQTLYVCGNGGRSFVVAGEGQAPGCTPVADPVRDLHLAPAAPDPAELARALSSLSARVDRLELLLTGSRSRSRPLARPAPGLDPFDTQGRTRDLGQDIERRLDEIGR